MKRFWWICLFVGSLIGTVSAQDEGEPPANDGAEAPRGMAQPQPPNEMLPTGPEAGRMRMRWAFQRVSEELNLTEEQRAKFDEITAKHEGDMLDLEDRWREIREAQRAGDTEKADRLRAEMHDQRGPESGMAMVLEELEPILDEEQVAKLWDMQDQMQQRRADRERFQWVMTDLPEELGLDPGQKIHYQKMLDMQREKMAGSMADLRPLMEQVREARAAGDHEKARELQKLLVESVPKREDMLDQFLDELPNILNGEQIAALESARANFGAEAGDGKENEISRLDARAVLRAAQRIRFADDQKDRLREIQRETIAAYRKIPRKDQEAHAKLGEDVKAKIAAVCDEKQKKDFNEILQRLESRRKHEKKP